MAHHRRPHLENQTRAGAAFGCSYLGRDHAVVLRRPHEPSNDTRGAADGEGTSHYRHRLRQGGALFALPFATALRPRPAVSSISFRYGSQALAVGARLGGGGPVGSPAEGDKPTPKSANTSLPGFARSVDTSMACFGGWPHRSAGRTPRPAAFRYAPTVSRRTPVAADAAQRPAQPTKGNDLLLLRVAQEIGHGDAGTTVPGAASRS
jgi:hypothetical protein